MLKDSPAPLARLHALWTLGSIVPFDAEFLEAASRLTSDPHPGLRENALRVLAGHFELPTENLVRLAEDPAIRVRFQVAQILGDRRLKSDPDALKALGRIAAKDATDPWMRLAILSGLAETALKFIPLCDAIEPSEGRSQLLTKPPRSSEPATLSRIMPVYWA